MAITHSKVSAKSDGGDSSLVLPSEWNAAHVLDDGTVTLAKMANLAQNRIIGRVTGSTGVPESLTAANVKTILALTAADITADSTTLVGVGTTVQAVFEELDNGIADHLADTTDAHAASAIGFTPTGTIAATTVQAAIAEMLQELTTQVTFAKEGTLATATGAFRWYNDTGRTLTFTSARASVTTVPTGAAIICDVNVNGTTCFVASSQANRPTIAISGNTNKTTTFDSISTIADGSYITVDIDQIGSTIAGANLTVQIFLKG